MLGVPSSAAAHWPGQEKAPQALREAGLPELLRGAGHDVTDYGDRPVARWRAHPEQRRPHDLSRVVEVLQDARKHVGAILAAERTPLVVGGECSVSIAVVAAALDNGLDPALLYFDGGPDLRTPEDNPTGIVDSMTAAHLLDRPGAAAELAGIGRRRPLLSPDRIAFFGVNSLPAGDPAATGEDKALASLPSHTLRAVEVAADPVAAAREAAAALAVSAERFFVHFDVDVIDFYDLPAANWPEYNKGLTLADATAALAVLVAQPGFAGLTVTEFNPDHGEPDGSTARALAGALVAAFSG